MAAPLRRRRIAAAATLALLPVLAGADCDLSGLVDRTGGDIGGVSDYVGATVCRGCHAEVHAAWAASKHAGALELLRSSGADRSADCLPCHTTGYRRGGFVSTALTPGFAGVQCEACHGPGASHVASRHAADIVRTPNSQACGVCHQQPEQPNLEEWMQSAHARAIDSVRNDPAGRDECLTCHSFDYAAAQRRNAIRALRGLPPDPLPSLFDADPANDPVTGVDCASCHAPHASVEPADLRAGPTQTCVICHSDADTSPAALPHSPQWNLLRGTGGLRNSKQIGTPTATLAGSPHVHSEVDALGGCAKCHGPNLRVATPTPEQPNLTGHRFEVLDNLCLPCHQPNVAQELRESLRAEVTPRTSALQGRVAAINEAALDGQNRQRYRAAIANLALIAADGSTGAHNAVYVRAILDATDELLTVVEAAQ